jgi:predicted ATP-dependent endonuclease of OLD family
VKGSIRKKHLGDTRSQEALKLEEESVRFLLWLDGERASLFFADSVVICEGVSEKALFEYLIGQEWPEFRNRNIYIADAMGKFNVHRLIALLSRLGIRHSVLIDHDGDADIHKIVNDFIEERRTELTILIKSFATDLEAYLEIPKPPRPDLKPLNVLVHLRSGKITEQKKSELKSLLMELVDMKGPNKGM